jgi:hypothetical protein
MSRKYFDWLDHFTPDTQLELLRLQTPQKQRGGALTWNKVKAAARYALLERNLRASRRQRRAEDLSSLPPAHHSGATNRTHVCLIGLIYTKIIRIQ